VTDNQSSMALAHNLANHQSMKHIRMKYHFIREVIKLQEIELWYTPTKEQVADALTKPLSRVKFPGFVSWYGDGLMVLFFFFNFSFPYFFSFCLISLSGRVGVIV
jgi:hypothetical protein